MKNSNNFHISAQNIDCGYSLEPPCRGDSNEYPQAMFLSRNKKNYVYPCKPQFYYIKVGLKGSKLYRHVFMMKTKQSQSSRLSPAKFVYRAEYHCVLKSTIVGSVVSKIDSSNKKQWKIKEKRSNKKKYETVHNRGM